MPAAKIYLYSGVIISLILHGSILLSFDYMAKSKVIKKHYDSSLLVPVQIAKKKIPKPASKKVKPKPKEPKKIVKKKKPPPKVIKKTKVNPLPVSHQRTENKEVSKVEDVKPVFGVTKKTVAEGIPRETGVAVRVGNTLMKEMEAEYTPPEEVRQYVTIPVFDLTILPEFKSRVTPEYPESLQDLEIEGKVFLSATIDDRGVVTAVRVLRSDHELFSKAATIALLASVFRPATHNGEPVGTILDELVYTFVLDE